MLAPPKWQSLSGCGLPLALAMCARLVLKPQTWHVPAVLAPQTQQTRARCVPCHLLLCSSQHQRKVTPQRLRCSKQLQLKESESATSLVSVSRCLRLCCWLCAHGRSWRHVGYGNVPPPLEQPFRSLPEQEAVYCTIRTGNAQMVVGAQVTGGIARCNLPLAQVLCTGLAWRHDAAGLALARRTRPPVLTSRPRLTLAQCTPPLALATPTRQALARCTRWQKLVRRTPPLELVLRSPQELVPASAAGADAL